LNLIAVITTSGAYWPRTVHDTTIDAATRIPGSLFGGPDAKYVLDGGNTNLVFVVNKKGEVWLHVVSSGGVGTGQKLNGPSLFGGPNDKYVVYDDFGHPSILVITIQGEVWAHDLSNASGGGFDTVGAGHKLNGPALFGGPNDKYVVRSEGRLLVVNTLGEVWAHDLSNASGGVVDTVGAGYKLNGPALFGGPNDKYVIAYHVG
jgi:hypothetical protein